MMQKLGWVLVGVCIASAVVLLIFFISGIAVADINPFQKKNDNSVEYIHRAVMDTHDSTVSDAGSTASPVNHALPIPRMRQIHIEQPEHIRGIYMSSWVAGTRTARNRLVDLIDSTDLNTVVIDIKDSTGVISYRGSVPLAIEVGSYSNRIPDLRSFIKLLHQKNIYVIGRVAVFEDPLMSSRKPNWAVVTLDGQLWKNRRGISWVDPGTREYWNYIVDIAREAHALGVDEINLDYIRYPSDGNLTDIAFLQSAHHDADFTKTETIHSFFQYIDSQLRSDNPDNVRVPVSADVFGLTTTVSDGLGIGQRWEDIIPYVDAICPMIYPSHYASGSFGFTNPAEHPGRVVARATEGAIERTNLMGESVTKIRPWIQDFDMGARYGVAEVEGQIQALHDLGVTSWLVWDPSNRYTRDAYLHIDE